MSEAIHDLPYLLLSFWSRVSFGGTRTEASLRSRAARLRALLRRFPRWYSGHFQLGETELKMLLIQDQRPNPRSIGAIRVSAEVVLLLMSHRSSRRKINARFVFEARTLLALSYFFQKRYSQAHSEFSSVLAFNNRSLLRPKFRYLALEYGGLTAFLAERFDEAFEYLSAVPSNLLSKEGAMALDRSSREQENF